VGADTQPQTPTKPTLTPLQATVELVKRGHREMLPRLRELLTAQPEVFRYAGDLGMQAQQAWADMIAGPDHLLRESMILFAEDMKLDLVGPKASRLEKVAAERIVAAWMESEYFRLWLVQHPQAEGTKFGALNRKRYDEADRRLERATTALANIKRLLPRTIEVQVLQKPEFTSPMQSIIGNQAGSDLPKVGDIQPARKDKVLVDGTAMPVNRITGNGRRNACAEVRDMATSK
jgi:hypothetical protein